MARERWYHGGPAGLTEILPSATTGAASCASYGARGVCRRDRVYLVNRLALAWIYARFSRDGMVYDVAPVGAIEPDPDFLDDGSGVRGVQCERARIVGRHRRPG